MAAWVHLSTSYWKFHLFLQDISKYAMKYTFWITFSLDMNENDNMLATYSEISKCAPLKNWKINDHKQNKSEFELKIVPKSSTNAIMFLIRLLGGLNL